MAASLLMAASVLYAGCGNSSTGLTTSGLFKGDTSSGVTNDSPMARPISVAWTSARAQRCGFYFDPAKLRASYVGYETKQGAAGEQLAKIEKTYDQTFKVISDRVSADADYCSDKRSSEIKADLNRHLAGDFAPNLPKAKPVVSCGFFGCGDGSSEQAFDSKTIWDEQAKKRGP